MSSVKNSNSRIEIEFLKLELQAVEIDVEKKSTWNSSFKTRVPPFTFPITCAASSSPVLLSFSPSSNLRSPALDSSSLDLRSPKRFLDLVPLLLLPISSSSCSSSSLFTFFFGTRVFKTWVLVHHSNQNSSLGGSIFPPNSSFTGLRCYFPHFFQVLAN